MSESSIARARAQVLRADNGQWSPMAQGYVVVDVYFNSSTQMFRFIAYDGSRQCILNAAIPSGTSTTASYKPVSPVFHQYQDVASGSRIALGFNFPDQNEASVFADKVAKVLDGSFLKNLIAMSPNTPASPAPPAAPPQPPQKPPMAPVPPSVAEKSVVQGPPVPPPAPPVPPSVPVAPPSPAPFINKPTVAGTIPSPPLPPSIPPVSSNTPPPIPIPQTPVPNPGPSGAQGKSGGPPPPPPPPMPAPAKSTEDTSPKSTSPTSKVPSSPVAKTGGGMNMLDELVMRSKQRATRRDSTPGDNGGGDTSTEVSKKKEVKPLDVNNVVEKSTSTVGLKDEVVRAVREELASFRHELMREIGELLRR